MEAIQSLKEKFKESRLFFFWGGVEKDKSFHGRIGQIYQTWDGQELYPSVEEKVGITYLVTKLDSVTRTESKVPINEMAGSHMARRTFIGNIYKLVKDPNLVSALTGHVEGSRAFTRYRTIDIDMKKDLVKILEGKQ